MDELKKYMCDDVIGIVKDYVNNDIDYSRQNKIRETFCFLQNIAKPLVTGGYCLEIGQANDELEFIRIDENAFINTYLNNVYPEVKEMWGENERTTLFKMIDSKTHPVAVIDLWDCRHLQYSNMSKNDYKQSRNRYGY